MKTMVKPSIPAGRGRLSPGFALVTTAASANGCRAERGGAAAPQAGEVNIGGASSAFNLALGQAAGDDSQMRVTGMAHLRVVFAR